jgi:hypothetical protein
VRPFLNISSSKKSDTAGITPSLLECSHIGENAFDTRCVTTRGEPHNRTAHRTNGYSACCCMAPGQIRLLDEPRLSKETPPKSRHAPLLLNPRSRRQPRTSRCVPCLAPRSSTQNSVSRMTDTMITSSAETPPHSALSTRSFRCSVHIETTPPSMQGLSTNSQPTFCYSIPSLATRTGRTSSSC